MRSPKPNAQPASASAKAPSARRFYRINSWLSETDANFLLSKRALWEANLGHYATAIQLFNRLMAFEPETAEHYVNRGLVRTRNQQWDKAMADYDRAIELDDTLDKAYSNRANLYARRQNWAEAINDYDEAIDLNPLNIRARLNQAITFREMGDHNEALICLDIALFFQPDSAVLYAERGRIYHVQGDWNCAIADYQTALSLTEVDQTQYSDLKVTHKVRQWMASLSQ